MSNYDAQLALLHPVGHWPLADAVGSTVAADASGNGHNATLQGGTPTFGIPGPILHQTALNNNNSEWLTDIHPDATWSALTVIAWILGPWFGAGGSPRIVAAGHTDSDNTGFQLGFFNNLAFDVGGKGLLSFGSSGTWDATKWHMLCGTYDGSTGAAALYLDGTQEASATWSAGSLVAASADLGFGYNSAYGSDQWSGDLAEPAILKSALTAAQVQALVAAAKTDYPGWIGEAGWL